jgi:hypothetical protein
MAARPYVPQLMTGATFASYRSPFAQKLVNKVATQFRRVDSEGMRMLDKALRGSPGGKNYTMMDLSHLLSGPFELNNGSAVGEQRGDYWSERPFVILNCLLTVGYTADIIEQALKILDEYGDSHDAILHAKEWFPNITGRAIQTYADKGNNSFTKAEIWGSTSAVGGRGKGIALDEVSKLANGEFRNFSDQSTFAHGTWIGPDAKFAQAFERSGVFVDYFNRIRRGAKKLKSLLQRHPYGVNPSQPASALTRYPALNDVSCPTGEVPVFVKRGGNGAMISATRAMDSYGNIDPGLVDLSAGYSCEPTTRLVGGGQMASMYFPIPGYPWPHASMAPAAEVMAEAAAFKKKKKGRKTYKKKKGKSKTHKSKKSKSAKKKTAETAKKPKYVKKNPSKYKFVKGRWRRKKKA